MRRLIDRPTGTVQLAHLNFQEHLTAYHVFITREGDERVATAQSHMGDKGWWETLRLWAALAGDRGPDKLGPVLDVLRADPDACWLAGQIFADGTGRSSDFGAWSRSCRSGSRTRSSGGRTAQGGARMSRGHVILLRAR